MAEETVRSLTASAHETISVAAFIQRGAGVLALGQRVAPDGPMSVSLADDDQP